MLKDALKPIQEINILEPLLVLSKKYYAGGEIVTEMITPQNQDMNTNITVTFKKGEDVFRLGKKYRVTFTQVEEKEV